MKQAFESRVFSFPFAFMYKVAENVHGKSCGLWIPLGNRRQQEHPAPDEVDIIPDWWCHPCGALPVLCLTQWHCRLQSHTHTLTAHHAHMQTAMHTTYPWNPVFVAQVKRLVMVKGVLSLVFRAKMASGYCQCLGGKAALQHCMFFRGQTEEGRQRLLHCIIYPQSQSLQ